MNDKKVMAALYADARATLVKKHHDEYRDIIRELAADRGITIRARRTAAEVMAEKAARAQAVADRKAAREAAKAAKAEAARLAKIEKKREELAALEVASA